MKTKTRETVVLLSVVILCAAAYRLQAAGDLTNYNRANIGSGNSLGGNWSTITGGANNTNKPDYSVIAGGHQNTIRGSAGNNSSDNVIAGGFGNLIGDDVGSCVISGGSHNQISDDS